MFVALALLSNVALSLASPASVGHQTVDAEQLIDRLQDFSDDNEMSLFVGEFHEIPNTEEPIKFNFAYQQLIRQGHQSLPSLIRHLSDSRQTKLTVELTSGIGAMWFSDEYEPRYRDPKRKPSNINKMWERSVSKYTFRIGDLCYGAIGQIVNRQLQPLRGQPTGCLVINSPIERPELARAVMQDWGGLTRSDHIKQLQDDCNVFVRRELVPTVKRMIAFYPEEGEKLALKFLNRNIYDFRAVWSIADNQLMKTDDPAKWRKIVSLAVKEHGEVAASTLPYWIEWSQFGMSSLRKKEQQDRAKDIFAKIFPDFDPLIDKFHNVADAQDHAELIEGLQEFPSKKIDVKVQSIFWTVSTWSESEHDRQDEDHLVRHEMNMLALACCKRMINRGYNRQYLQYFESRIDEMKTLPDKSWERYDVKDFETTIKDLRKNPKG